MLFKIAKVFSSGTEYEIFRDNYCENGCKFHKVREADGFPEFTDYGRLSYRGPLRECKVQCRGIS